MYRALPPPTPMLQSPLRSAEEQGFLLSPSTPQKSGTLLPPLPAEADYVSITQIQSELDALIRIIEALAPRLMDKGRLARKCHEVQQVLAARSNDIETFRQDTNVSAALWHIHQSIFDMDRKAHVLKLQTLMLASTKRRKLEKKWVELHNRTNSLLMNVAVAMASNYSASPTREIEDVASGEHPEEALQAAIWGDKFLFGYGVARSYETAFKRYQRAAELSLPIGMNMLGMMYEQGLGRETNMDEAVKWYSASADAKDTEGINNLARLYESGKGLVRDYDMALNLYLEAAEKGNMDAATSAGHMFERGIGTLTDYQTALRWYTVASNKGLARAQNFLGSLYFAGKGTKQDPDEAFKWFKKAAEQGNPHAQNNVVEGICYEEGKGVARDYESAKYWYQLSSQNKHHPHACNNLGYIYLLEEKYDEAIKLFHLAIALGNVDAHFNIANMYEAGVGLKKDRNAAIRHFQAAVDLGYEKARPRLAALVTKMSTKPRHKSTASMNSAYITTAASSAEDLTKSIDQLSSMKPLKKAGTIPSIQTLAEKKPESRRINKLEINTEIKANVPSQRSSPIKVEEQDPWLAEIEQFANEIGA